MRRSLLALSVLLAIAPGCGSCASCGTASTQAVVEASVVVPPVPAPDGLVLQAWVRAPDALWARVQNGVSGAAGLLPAEVGSLLCAAFSLDSRIAPHVDSKGTAFVVVASGGHEGADLVWATALPLREPDPLVSLIVATEAGPAPYSGRNEDGMGVLTRPGRPLPVTLAYAPGWLLLASDEAALLRLAPYAWRTMPTLPPPAGTASVVAVVAHEALASRAGAAWAEARGWLAARDREQRAKHGGRAPDFGDPQAILDAADTFVKRRVALLAGARSATMQLEAGEDDVHAELQLEPGVGEASDAGDVGAALAGMRPGDTRPLADTPGDAVLSVLVRDSASTRADDAREIEAAIALALGARAHDDDERAVASAIDAWAASRGDWLSASLAWEPSRALVVRSPGGDAAGRALRGLIELASRPVFAGPLHGAFDLGRPSFAATRVDGIAAASLATFGAQSPLGIAWGARGDELLAVAGEHADRQFATTPARVGDDPRVARVLSALGSDASLVVLAEPLRLEASRAASDAARSPAVLAWGRRDGRAWLRVDVGDELLREVVRLQGGL